MSRSAVRLLAVAGLSAAVCGCKSSDTGSTSAPTAMPPGGPPPGASAPGGPGSAPGAGTTARAPSEAGSDAVMTGKVKNALITSKVDTRKLNVDTRNGVVNLNGSVPTASQKSLAAKVAKQVSGVTTVKDNLTVGATK